MKYKLFYGTSDLTDDQPNEYIRYRYFHHVKSDEEAMEKARTFIRKENWFEHLTGDTSDVYFIRLARVVKDGNGKEKLVPVPISYYKG